MYTDIEGADGIPGYELYNFGCGPASMATILSSLGFDMDPIAVAKQMFLDEYGNPIDFYTNRESGRLGSTTLGFIYLLQQLSKTRKLEIDYLLVKYSYEHPELKKEEVLEMIQNGYMSLILVGPKGQQEHPRTFSNYGHYIALTSVNRVNREFYVANPNRLGDSQIDTTYSYETLIANMYTNTYDFLMIKNDTSKSLILK